MIAATRRVLACWLVSLFLCTSAWAGEDADFSLEVLNDGMLEAVLQLDADASVHQIAISSPDGSAMFWEPVQGATGRWVWEGTQEGPEECFSAEVAINLAGDGSGDHTSSWSPKKAKAHKIAICHVPKGNPDNAHTIYVSKRAAKAHIGRHGGDYAGPCESNETSLTLAATACGLFE